MKSSATIQALALDTSQVKTYGLGAILVVVLIGLLVSFVVTKIVTKIVTIVVMVVLAFVLWGQRQHVVDSLDKHAKNCDATFFGVHVKASNDAVKAACAKVAKQNGS
ncbi:hypothetical protein M6D93_18985 [Jatrophihabitans telluris]|uniref:Uncharacterized protein n=1 Tax=Jatrophihabitans telluris TaxID=2038343 RepID=A0ABY4QZU0_9ACTN|nr:hypothetical protein [Jatrophihabitans telluris]UQX88344.1 hypothetical protein M6D93_18985 [Jatrophihabitans telluris]